MSLSRQFGGGAYMRSAAGVAPTTAGVSSTSTGLAAVNGPTIDRQAYSRSYFSCRSVARGRFVGSSVGAATLAAAFQHSSDGTSWDNFSTATNVTGAVGSITATGAQSAVDGFAEQIVSLQGARRYIRQVITPAFVATTAGDVLYYAGNVILTGADELPNT